MEQYILLGTWILATLFVTGIQMDNVAVPVPKNPIMFTCFAVGAILVWPAVIGVLLHRTWKQINEEEERLNHETAALHKQEGENSTTIHH